MKGWVRVRALVPCFVLLALAIPLPLHIDADIIARLQKSTTHGSSWLLDVLDIPHVVAGYVVEIPGHRLLIEEGCSGVNSLWTSIAFVLFLGFWLRRPGWHVALLTCGSFAFALVVNVCRVTIGVCAQAKYDIDLFTGWAHEGLGVLLFVLVLALAGSLDQLLLFLGETVGANKKSGTPASIPIPVTDRMVQQGGLGALPHWAVWSVCAPFGVLGLFQVSTWAAHLSEATTSQSANALARPVLPKQLGAWQQASMVGEPTERLYPRGLVSELWHYSQGRLTAVVSFDAPFRGWHELTGCYKTQGWEINERSVQWPNEATPFVEVSLEQRLKAHARLCFGMRKEQGGWLAPEVRRAGLVQRFRARFAEPTIRESDCPTNQVQVFVHSYVPFSATETEQVRELFVLVQRTLEQTLPKQLEPNS